MYQSLSRESYLMRMQNEKSERQMSTRAPIQVMTMNVTVTVIMSTTAMMMVTQLERNLSDGCLMKKENIEIHVKNQIGND